MVCGPQCQDFRWQAQGGKTVPQRTYVPKSRYLLPKEREAILAYKFLKHGPCHPQKLPFDAYV